MQERSHAYTDGGYWLQLWGFLLSSAILLLLLHAGWSRRMRDWAERRSRRGAVRTFLYYVGFTLAVTLLDFPLTVYAGFVREHAYGMATQGFGGWLRDQAVGLGVSLVLGGAARDRRCTSVLQALPPGLAGDRRRRDGVAFSGIRARLSPRYSSSRCSIGSPR